MFGNGMNSKRLLRFYFKADDLDRTIDNLIFRVAVKSVDCDRGGDFYVERILALTEAKDKLSELWHYLDGVIGGLKEERGTLEGYALMRTGIRRLADERQREIRRALIKFVRHARAVDRFEEGIRLVNGYYCLL